MGQKLEQKVPLVPNLSGKFNSLKKEYEQQKTRLPIGAIHEIEFHLNKIYDLLTE